MKSQKGFSLIIIMVGVLILALAGFGIYYFGKHSLPNQQVNNSNKINTATNSASNKTNTATNSAEQKKSTDLGLIPQAENQTVTYYDVGTIPSGQYKGYKRIVGVSDGGSGYPMTYILATNDNKHYILNGDPADVTRWPTTDDHNPYFGLDKSNITQVADLLGSFPQTITLNDQFILSRESMDTMLEKTGQKDTQGNDLYAERLQTSFSSLQKLQSPDSQLSLYAQSIPVNPAAAYDPDGIKKDASIKDQYLKSTTQVVVVDSQGLAYLYSLTTPKANSTFTAQNTKYLNELNVYANSKNQDKLNYPNDFPLDPNLRFVKADATVNTTIYNSYDVAFPHACGTDVNTYVVKNISETDLIKVGSENGIDLYALKDTGHPLDHLAFDTKTLFFNSADDFQQANNKAEPTFADYVTKTPLLFMQDYWGRWVVLGEYDYQLPGGCGKPVVYLYPTKPTEVTVHFISPMQLDTDIPTYHNGWDVLAQPNGLLKDLQPQYTDCDALNTNKFGSEYAGQACVSNEYPYLYWAGRSLENPYPAINTGWIVPQDNLSQFMNQKLTQVGLNDNEKKDMLSYWIPEMLAKNTPYYKISFLQTSQMNQLAPMDISPKPDTVFRIFLDYTPLVSKPTIAISPEHLNTLQRNGFTVVEWGGLKR